jgi:hypothetical protein
MLWGIKTHGSLQIKLSIRYIAYFLAICCKYMQNARYTVSTFVLLLTLSTLYSHGNVENGRYRKAISSDNAFTRTFSAINQSFIRTRNFKWCTGKVMVTWHVAVWNISQDHAECSAIWWIESYTFMGMMLSIETMTSPFCPAGMYHWLTAVTFFRHQIH